MRKKNLLSLAVLSMVLAILVPANAQSIGLQPTNDPYDLRQKVDITKVTPEQIAADAKFVKERPQKKAGLKQIYKEKAATTTTYLAVQQSMYNGYSFAYLDGDVMMWYVDVTIDGTVATISNLFNLDTGEAWDTTTEEDIIGEYDAEAGTITIQTSSVFDEATIVGSFYGTYPAVMFAGKVDKSGTLVEVHDELIFTIDTETNTITTDQHYGCSMYTADGTQSYGVQECFAKTILTQQTEEANLILFGQAIDFGELYINYPATASFKLVNIGKTAGEYVIDLEGECFTVTPESGIIEPLQMCTFTVNFEGLEANQEYEGIITVTTDNGDELIQLYATTIPYPDYSPIILNGDIELRTGMEYPFALDDTMVEGKTVAKMTIPAGYRTYTQSYLTAIVEVPEGHIGTLSWKGIITSSVGWNALGGIFIDEETNPNAVYVYQNVFDYDMSNSQNFGPGKHTVRFVWEAPYAGADIDKMAVYDLSFDYVEATDYEVSVESDLVEFGNYIIEGESVQGMQIINLLNEGKQPLKVLSATSTENFSIEIPEKEAALLEYLPVTAKFVANAAGTYEDEIVITTTAGDITLRTHAFVREMPDFNSIVLEGDFVFETNADNPYIVENGVAYNSTSKVPDPVPTTSWLKASFTIPDGKIGNLTWDASFSGKAAYNAQYQYVNGEQGMLEIKQPMTMYQWIEYAYQDGLYEVEMGSDELIAKSDEWNDYSKYTIFAPGEHYIMVTFNQGGDNETWGEDRLSLYNLKLVLSDFEDYAVKTDVEELAFETVYAGSGSKKQNITFTNTGGQDFEIYNVTCEGPFVADLTKNWPIAFNNKLTIPVRFLPTEAGVYENDLVFETTVGQVIIKCRGEALSREGTLLVEDFEDDAKNWITYDCDRDGLSWDLGSNLLGGEEEKYVRSGRQALVSMSYNYNLGGLTPDNWAISPAFAIPETSTENVKLTWWVALQVADSYVGDFYTVYISDKELAETFTESDWVELFSEAPQTTEWEMREIDLSSYAGKTCRVAFRHHNCEDNWMLKIDDLVVYDGTTGINGIENSDKVIVSQEFYSIDGMRIEKPENGIYIVKTMFDDGSSAAKKAIVRNR